MAYRLSFWHVLEAFFVPVDYLYWAIFLSGVAIPLGALVYALRAGVPCRKLIFLPAAVMVVLATIVGISLLYTGSGWLLEDGGFRIKANPGPPALVELKNARIALVESTGPWQPTLRMRGLGLPGVSIGRFRFKNGKEALYFRHLKAPKAVVLESEDRYYVLSYPGVEELYRKLIARGAQPSRL